MTDMTKTGSCGALAAAVILLMLVLPALTVPAVPPGNESKKRDLFEKTPTYKVVTRDWTGIEPSETSAIEMNGKLYIAWQGKNARPDGGSRGGIFFRTFDDSGPMANASWGPVMNLTPTENSGDRFGHANDYPVIINHSGSAYVVWETSDDSQKMSPRNTTDSDIVMKKLEGSAWGQTIILNDAAVENSSWNCFHPQAVSFGGVIYVAWERMVNNSAELVVRSYDGTLGPETVVSPKSEKTRNAWPFFQIYKGALRLVWESNDADAARTLILMSSNSGGGWSAPRTLYEVPVGNYKDAFPKLEVYNNPVTGNEELWAAFRVIDGEGATYREGGDQDIVMRRVDETTLGQCIQISPVNDRADDVRPNLIALGPGLHVVWTTNDDSTSDGSDYDIVMRSYDGTALSPVSSLSIPGDRDRQVVLDTEPHNLGDDEFPSVTTYRNRLFSLYETYDNVTGIPDAAPDVNTRAIVMKLAVDTDSDADGRPDSSDAFPLDPKEIVDSDGDGTGDNGDYSPFDPGVWKKPPVKDATNPLACYALVAIIAVLGVCAAGLVAFGGRSGGPDQREDELAGKIKEKIGGRKGQKTGQNNKKETQKKKGEAGNNEDDNKKEDDE